MPIAALSDRALIAVTGADARPFLNTLLTQDVESLAPGQLRFGALLTPQGRVLFDLFLRGTDDGVWLDVATERRDALIQRLSLYRLRAKVEIAPLETPVLAAWGEDGPPGWPTDPRVADLGRRGHGEATVTATAADYETHRLALGVPDSASDVLADKDYPIEANFDLLNGIDFHKGCFVGQETTSRMKRRGTIKTRLLPVSFDGDAPPPGSEVLAGDLRAGEIRTGQAGRAMALLRLDRLDGPLTVEGRPVKVHRPVWLGL